MNVFKRHSKVHSGGESKDYNVTLERVVEGGSADSNEVENKQQLSGVNCPSTDTMMTPKRSVIATLVHRFSSFRNTKVRLRQNIMIPFIALFRLHILIFDEFISGGGY